MNRQCDAIFFLENFKIHKHKLFPLVTNMKGNSYGTIMIIIGFKSTFQQQVLFLECLNVGLNIITDIDKMYLKWVGYVSAPPIRRRRFGGGHFGAGHFGAGHFGAGTIRRQNFFF